MEVRKGFKQTEVGVIPDDWQVTTLAKVCQMKSGDSITSAGIDEFSKYPCYGGNGLRGFTSRFTHDGKFALIGRQGALCGNVLGVEGKFFASEHAIVVTALAKSDIQWLTYVLGEMRLNQYSESSAQPGLSVSKILSLGLALPPTKAEQEAIAEALSDADALIEAVEQLITKKRQVKQGAMSELLTGKRRLTGFSGNWEVKTFGELFNFSGGFTASRDQLSSDGYCYLHYGDIHMSKKTFVDVQAEFQDIPKLNIPLKKVSATSLLEDGDIVFVDASEDDEGTSRHVVIVNPNKIPYISGLHTIVAKSKTDGLEKQYRRYCFQTREVKNQFRFYAVGTKVSGISKTNIAKINLPVPSIPEQTAIAEILSDMDAEISALEEKLVKARQVKAGMMSELLTGKIRLNRD